MIEPTILLETASFLAINKPAGWVVNESNTAHGNPTVQSWIEKNFTFPLSQDSSLRNGIVHRLDKQTSGVLLIAKTKAVFEALQKQFADRIPKKTYQALVHGTLTGGGTINAPIMRNPMNRTRFAVLPNGRPAISEYKVIQTWGKGNNTYSLLDVMPQTGRTHQIRVHLSHIKHPVVSDPLYAGRKTLRRDLEWCPRMFLHAASLTFQEPTKHTPLTVVAPLPDDLLGASQSL